MDSDTKINVSDIIIYNKIYNVQIEHTSKYIFSVVQE